MKYNWSAVVEEFRKIILTNVKIYRRVDSTKVSEGLMNYFAFELAETDTFHPYDSDGELSRAMDRMPKRCNYRSCESYHAWKDGRENIADALYSMLIEVSERVEEHFGDMWNFEPGTKLPGRIDMPQDWSNTADKSVNRILKAAKQV